MSVLHWNFSMVQVHLRVCRALAHLIFTSACHRTLDDSRRGFHDGSRSEVATPIADWTLCRKEDRVICTQLNAGTDTIDAQLYVLPHSVPSPDSATAICGLIPRRTDTRRTADVTPVTPSTSTVSQRPRHLQLMRAQ